MQRASAASGAGGAPAPILLGNHLLLLLSVGSMHLLAAGLAFVGDRPALQVITSMAGFWGVLLGLPMHRIMIFLVCSVRAATCGLWIMPTFGRMCSPAPGVGCQARPCALL